MGGKGIFGQDEVSGPFNGLLSIVGVPPIFFFFFFVCFQC